MGSQTSRSNTHVANATGKNLRIYYAKGKMEEDEIELYERGEIGGTASKTEQSESGKIPIHCIHLQKNGTCKIAGQGTIYVSVYEKHEDKKNGSNPIEHNYLVPSDQSFIVTANSKITLQKYGANIWVDEDGNNHHPPLSC